jgi:hypothetical protein
MTISGRFGAGRVRALTLAAFALGGVLLGLAAGGCATVKPWDRDLLSEDKMRLNPHPAISAVDDHIYFSKEGSTGGEGVGGGGCGCN